MNQIITQNNVNPFLKQIEKIRFHQISENFFKGGHYHFVQFQNDIIKSVDQDYLNNSFVRQYQDAIKQYESEVIKRNKVLEKDRYVEIFNNKLLDFIVICGSGVLLISRFPEFFKNISEKGMSIIEESKRKIEYFTEQFDYKNRIYDFFINFFSQLGSFMTGNIFSFFNGDNVFLKCFIELGKKIGKRANGTIGLIFDIVMSLIKKESYKKPDLKHWLLYGTKVYEDVKKVDDEFYNFYTNVQDNQAWYKFWDSDSEFGRWVKDGDDGNLVWYGLDAGSAWGSRSSLELEDVKKQVEKFHLGIQKGAEDISTKARVDGLYGLPIILNSDQYITTRQKYLKMTHRQIDLSGFFAPNEVFGNLQVNLKSKEGQKEQQKKLDELKKANDVIQDFYEKNKDNKNPIVKTIINEINQSLGGVKKIGDTLWLRQFLFVPPIYYAILQYEFIKERNAKIVASMGRKLTQLNDKLETYQKNTIEKQNDVFIKLESEEITFEDFSKYMTSFISNKDQHFVKLKDIKLEDELLFVDTFKKLLTTINDGIKVIENIAFGKEEYKSDVLVMVDQNDYQTYGEQYMGNEGQIVQQIVEKHKWLKGNLNQKYTDRKKILTKLDKLLGIYFNSLSSQ